jgi:large subunit ribosomal protein L10e
MAALRKAGAYSKMRVRPYTRVSRNKKNAFIKTIPHNKIVKFTSGDANAYKSGQHKFRVRFISESRVQIRDNALEAARMLITKILERGIPGQYYFAVKIYPHHILRDNKTASGAGADRTSSGMTQSFGVAIGRAAITQAGQEIFFISCTNERAARVARDALKIVKSKLPCKARVVFEKIVE